jgi:hypothetical protein
VAGDELGVHVEIDDLLGYIEYPSHLERGLDWPVGIAFRVHLIPSESTALWPENPSARWFTSLPDAMHDEQKAFLLRRVMGS